MLGSLGCVINTDSFSVSVQFSTEVERDKKTNLASETVYVLLEE
jgi:hypothetical protein